MWFKNIQAYRFTQAIEFDAETLGDLLQQHAFKPCGSQDLSSTGWTSPLGRHGSEFVHSANGYIMICSKRQDKLLPAMVINEELEDKISQLEERESRTVTRKERSSLKEEIIFELLPRAFVRSNLQFAYISLKDKMLLLNTSSEKRADEIVSDLRKAVGSLPLIPLACKNLPIDAMTQWLAKGKIGSGLTLGGECELRYNDDIASTIRCKNQDLTAAEILNHLKNGMHVAKLALTWDDRVEFLLDEKLNIKRLRFTDVVQEKIEKADDAAGQFDMDFAVMTLEISAFLNALLSALGGEDLSAQNTEKTDTKAKPSAPGKKVLEAV